MANERARWSLTRRVFAISVAAVLVAWSCGSAAIFSFAQREYERMCHANLENLALTISRFVEHEIREIELDGQPRIEGAPLVHSETAYTLGKRYAYQVWSTDGRLLLRSTRAPEAKPLGVLGSPGLMESNGSTRLYDSYVLKSSMGDMEIHVADLDDDGMEVSTTFGMAMGLAFLLSLLPVVLLTWLFMRGSFDTLVSAAEQLKSRRTTDLRPIQLSKPPRELAPLVDALNGLMRRARQTLDQEKKFTSLAAHELRTPLSALRAHAQVMARSRDPADIEQSSLSVQRSVDRCTRLIEQLLELARADARSTDRQSFSMTRLDEACADVVSDFVDEAARRKIEIHCDISVPEIRVDRVGLETLLRNLVSNAVRHTPDLGAISISAQREEREVVLCVDDSGEGIPESERSEVFRRFRRGSRPVGIGVGLGLSIVQTVADAHRAVVQLGKAPLGGLRVEVRFAQGAAAD